jgi:hypothetical protein
MTYIRMRQCDGYDEECDKEWFEIHQSESHSTQSTPTRSCKSDKGMRLVKEKNNNRLIMSVSILSRQTTKGEPEVSPAPSLSYHYIRA